MLVIVDVAILLDFVNRMMKRAYSLWTTQVYLNSEICKVGFRLFQIVNINTRATFQRPRFCHNSCVETYLGRGAFMVKHAHNRV